VGGVLEPCNNNARVLRLCDVCCRCVMCAVHCIADERVCGVAGALVRADLLAFVEHVCSLRPACMGTTCPAKTC